MEITMIDRKIWKRYQRKNQQREYLDYRKNQIYNTLLKKPYNHQYSHYADHEVLDFERTNKLIGDAITQGTGFWAGRYGMTEMQVMVHSINERLGLACEKEKFFEALCTGAGFFPNDITLVDRFVELMLEACKGIDLHAMWPMYMEDYFIKSCEKKDVKLTRLGDLEPWNLCSYTDYKGTLWSAQLAGKKVLVIHPFEDTIKMQYDKHRTDIFSKLLPAEKILPEFKLITMKAVQTIAGTKDDRFATWFDALAYMVDEAAKTDFDVAIVGCGAYGFPLSAEIKKMGKVVIHLGGATQLMFGIKGKRWESNEMMNRLVMNDSWGRPLETETPQNISRVEDGCYW